MRCFVLLLATWASLVACSTESDDTTVAQTGNCPAEPPAVGTPCGRRRLECHYGEVWCGVQTTFSCIDDMDPGTTVLWTNTATAMPCAPGEVCLLREVRCVPQGTPPGPGCPYLSCTGFEGYLEFESEVVCAPDPCPGAPLDCACASVHCIDGGTCTAASGHDVECIVLGAPGPEDLCM